MTNPKPENVKCPDCDGPMISRSGMYGVFWGCKKYPACKGTRDSMGRSKKDREEYKRSINKDKEDEEELGNILKEIGNHEIIQIPKVLFNKRTK